MALFCVDNLTLKATIVQTSQTPIPACYRLDIFGNNIKNNNAVSKGKFNIVEIREITIHDEILMIATFTSTIVVES